MIIDIIILNNRVRDMFPLLLPFAVVDKSSSMTDVIYKQLTLLKNSTLDGKIVFESNINIFILFITSIIFNRYCISSISLCIAK